MQEAAGVGAALTVSPVAACTGIMLKTADGSIVHGPRSGSGFTSTLRWRRPCRAKGCGVTI